MDIHKNARLRESLHRYFKFRSVEMSRKQASRIGENLAEAKAFRLDFHGGRPNFAPADTLRPQRYQSFAVQV